MKKILFILVLVMLTTMAFAQRSNDVYAIDSFAVNTSGGRETIFSSYSGKYCGQQSFNESYESYARSYEMVAGRRPDVSGIGKDLTKAQWDIVRQALDRWAHSTGDTYTISSLSGGWSVTVEFMSASQYKYWTRVN
jgi:hypothetical protein